MDLKAYLEKTNLSQGDFAKKFDPPVTQGLVWQWLTWLENPKKGTRITAERAKEIESLTGGEVTAHELRPDLFEAKAA
jgi:hypothetical protein